MKKALAIISALALMSMVAVAEDGVKVSGQIETGIQAGNSKVGDDAYTDYVKLWETDAPGATRIDLNVTATQGDTGLWFKLRSGDGTVSPSVANFKAYANLFSNMVTVTAGNPDDNQWKSSGDAGYTYEDGYGVSLAVKPIAGLNLGFKVATATPGATQYTAKQTLNEIGFGAKYTAAAFDVTAGYKLDSDADDAAAKTVYAPKADPDTGFITLNNATTTVSRYASKESEAYVGFDFVGVKNLTVKTEAKFTGLGQYDYIGGLTANEKVEYAFAPVTAGVLVYEYAFGSEQYSYADNKKLVSVSLKPYANYKLNDVTLVKGEFGYVINEGGFKNVNKLWISPGAEFQITPNSQIRADYTYTIDNTGDKDYYVVSGTATPKTISNTFNLGFRFNF